MTKAKETSDQYNQTREEGRSKLHRLFDEKNKRREALKIAFADEPERAKIEQKLMRRKLNEKRKEENKELIDKYQDLSKQKKFDEAAFQRGLEEFRKLDPEVDEQALKDLLMGNTKINESIETTSNLPSAVASQEAKAIAYFNVNNEAKHLQVIEQIKKLRTEGKINYTDLGNGKYSVTMPCGNKTLKMEFPPDTSLSDDSNNYTDRNEQEITNKETTRGKLQSKEGKKYLEQKEEQGQGLLSKSDFQTLIQSLYPEGSEQEQILSFMLATGFYGWMWLKDTTSNSQLAVDCYRNSDIRSFGTVSSSSYGCSIVHSTFIG